MGLPPLFSILLGTAGAASYRLEELQEFLQPVAASLSSNYSTWQYQADKCIDGNIDGVSGIGGNMCQSKEERSPWLAIDYGTPVIVHRVEIFNRDDCCGGRTKNVEVWISNHLLRTRNLLGTFVGPATDGQRITISGQQDVGSNSVQALSGRYVTVLMNNGDNVPLNLKEVRAYGKAGRNRRTESSSAYKRLEEPRRKFVFSSIGPENRIVTVVVIVISIVFFITILSVVLCCCLPCCPLAKRRTRKRGEAVQNGAQHLQGGVESNLPPQSPGYELQQTESSYQQQKPGGYQASPGLPGPRKSVNSWGSWDSRDSLAPGEPQPQPSGHYPPPEQKQMVPPGYPSQPPPYPGPPQGGFPINYQDPFPTKQASPCIPPPELPSHLAKVIHDFDAQPGTGEISIRVGEVLNIMRTDVGKGWWEGTCSNGDTGLFPAAYVEEISHPHPQPPPYPGPPKQEGFSYKQAP